MLCAMSQVIVRPVATLTPDGATVADTASPGGGKLVGAARALVPNGMKLLADLNQ